MRYILHIGLTKAGSTTIQAFLTANAARLLEQDIIYYGGEGGRFPPQHSWIGNAVNRQDPRVSSMLVACRAHSAAVLSGKTLFGLTPNQVAALGARLSGEGGGDSFRIILYVRNIADRLLSLCAQRAKVLGRSFETTIAQGPEDIGARIRVYEDVFGPEAVDVRLLEDAASLEQDFCTAAGIAWREDFKLPPRQNVSMDPISAQLLFALHTEYGRAKIHHLFGGSAKLPRLENYYLRLISGVVARTDVSHPKLARFADRLTSIRWRDESTETPFDDYMQTLARSLARLNKFKAGRPVTPDKAARRSARRAARRALTPSAGR